MRNYKGYLSFQLDWSIFLEIKKRFPQQNNISLYIDELKNTPPPSGKCVFQCYNETEIFNSGLK